MSYVAIIGSVVSIGAGVYQANQAKKATANAGGIPDAALYQPVDFQKEQMNTILGNQDALGNIRGLNNDTNNVITSQALKRITSFVPNFRSLMRTQANNAGSLIKGQLPYDDVLGIAENHGSLNNALGTPGTAMPGTLKDLGISRLNAQESGQGMMQRMVGMAEQVSPISRYSRPQDYYLYPNQTIPWELEQHQLEQQSQQSANNLKAGISPTQLAQNAAALSGATNPFSSVGPALGSIAGALKGSGGSGSGVSGYGSVDTAINAAPYAAGYSYDPAIGYSPVPYEIAA